jgi:hypothetical protein
MSRVYVIGDKETGVLFVLLDPLRVALVSRAEIEAYAVRHGIAPENAFGDVASAIHGLIRKTDGTVGPAYDDSAFFTVSNLIASGKAITEAEFCFVSEVDTADWKSFRNGFMPIEPVIAAMLAQGGGSAMNVPETPLKGPGD